MDYHPSVKPQHFYQDKNQRPAGAAHLASAGVLNQNKAEFVHANHDKNQRPAGAAHQASARELNQNKTEFVHAPSADEVATRAYFSYANQGFPHGRDVQHWLDAESEIISERNLTRTHGYPNKN
jgi:hypothetical protein